mmetsp:Transcript_13210/g.26950  ORF Transcript_13210/g.26950 Transcript_13210/m.26950 type:complete len:208 (+) Transcript_13210:448-1071(+)
MRPSDLSLGIRRVRVVTFPARIILPNRRCSFRTNPRFPDRLGTIVELELLYSRPFHELRRRVPGWLRDEGLLPASGEILVSEGVSSSRRRRLLPRVVAKGILACSYSFFPRCPIYRRWRLKLLRGGGRCSLLPSPAWPFGRYFLCCVVHALLPLQLFCLKCGLWSLLRLFRRFLLSIYRSCLRPVMVLFGLQLPKSLIALRQEVVDA